MKFIPFMADIMRRWPCAFFVLLLGLVGCSREARETRHLEKGNRYFEAKEFNKAQVEYQNVARLNSTNLTALSRLGAIFYSKGDLPKAYFFTTNAVGVAPADLDLRTRLGMIFLVGQDVPKAREQAVYVLTRSATNEAAVLLLADSSRAPADVAKALELLAGPPTNLISKAIYHAALGKLHMQQTNLARAEAAFKQAQVLDPRTTMAAIGLGGVYWQQGRLDEAGQQFEAAARIAPAQSTERLKWVEFKRMTGQRDQARQILEETTTQAPQFATAWLQLAEMAFEEQRHDDADRYLKETLKINPRYVDAKLLSAKLLIARGETAQGLNELDRLASEYPGSAKLQVERGTAYFFNKQLTTAEAAVREALKLDSSLAEAQLLAARIDLANGNHARAVVTLQQLLQRLPGLPSAYQLLAAAYVARGTPADAVPVYEQIERLTPSDWSATYQKGVVHRIAGKTNEARAAFATVLQAQSNNIPSRLQLIEMNTQARRFDEALQLVEQVANLTTNKVPPLMLKARVLRVQGKETEAERVLEEVIQIDPEHREAYLQWVDIAGKAERHQDALARTAIMLEKNPNDPTGLFLRAMLMEKKGDRPEAMKSYEALTQVATNSFVAFNNLAWLIGDKLGDWKRAAEYARKAYEIRRTDPSTIDTYGWALFNLGDYAAAFPLIQEAANALPGHPEVAYHLGAVLYMNGRETAAEQALVRSLASTNSQPWLEDAQARLAVIRVQPESAGPPQARLIEQAVQRNERDALAVFKLGRIHEKNSATNEAFSHYEKALAILPRFAPAAERLASLLAAQGNTDRAFQLARSALEWDPGNGHIRALLGGLALQRKEFSLARGWLRESASLRSDDARLWFQLAQAEFHLGLIEEARSSLSQAIQRGLKPDMESSGDFGEMLELQVRSGNVGDQEARVRSLLARKADYLPAWAVMARILEEKNQFAEAAAEYEKILQLYPDFLPASAKAAVLFSEKLNDDKRAEPHALKVRERRADDPVIVRVLGKSHAARGDWESSVRLLRQSVAAGQTNAGTLLLLAKSEAGARDYSSSRATLERILRLSPDPAIAQEVREQLGRLPKQ